MSVAETVRNILHGILSKENMELYVASETLLSL